MWFYVQKNKTKDVDFLQRKISPHKLKKILVPEGLSSGHNIDYYGG